MLQKFITVFGVRPSKILNTDSMRKTAKMTTGSVQSMLARTRAGNYRIETFDEAVSRLGLDEARLERRRKELMIESRIAYSLMFASILMMFYFVHAGESSGILSGVCAVTIFGVLGLTRAFRVHQIDSRSLMDFKSYLRSFDGVLK